MLYLLDIGFQDILSYDIFYLELKKKNQLGNKLISNQITVRLAS